VGRKQSIPEGAEGTTVYLTPEHQLMLRAVQAKRKKKLLGHAGLNEIWIDALEKLARAEGVTKEKLDALLADE
jgi:hypothetical protein